MIPEYTLAPMTVADQKAVIDLFNHYVEHSFAAYPEYPVPYEFFTRFLAACTGYPSIVVKEKSGHTIGFGLLHPHHPLPAFSHTAEISYFVHPAMTGKGVGSMMLDYLEREGKQQGISCLLANISSLNERSIRFHEQHGFTECGRFKGVGKKKGQLFDTVWMQKVI